MIERIRTGLSGKAITEFIPESEEDAARLAERARQRDIDAWQSFAEFGLPATAEVQSKPATDASPVLVGHGLDERWEDAQEVTARLVALTIGHPQNTFEEPEEQPASADVRGAGTGPESFHHTLVNDPTDSMEVHEPLSSVMRVLAETLTERDKRLFWRYIDGATLQEVSQEFDVPVDRVERVILRARSILVSEMDRENSFGDGI